MNKLIFYIAFLSIIFCDCSRNNGKDLLDNKSLENYSKNWNNISDELVQLELNDKELYTIPPAFTPISIYNSDSLYICSFASIFIFSDEYDINEYIKLFNEFLEMDIPISVNNIYKKYGLKYGHKTYMKISLGSFILRIEKMDVYMGFLVEELEKQKVETLKRLFNKKDLEIINNNLDKLPIIMF